MREDVVYELYTRDRKRRVQVFLNKGVYDLYVQFFDAELNDYYDNPDVRHITDTLEHAMKMARMLLM